MKDATETEGGQEEELRSNEFHTFRPETKQKEKTQINKKSTLLLKVNALAKPLKNSTLISDLCDERSNGD